MHLRILSTLILALQCVTWLAAQNTAPEAVPAQQQMVVLEPIQGGWSATTTGKAEDVGLDMGMTVAGRWNEMRTVRKELLATRQGQLQPADRALLRERADDLTRMAPNSFEAHMAHYYAEFPSSAAFDALGNAFRTAPERPELAGPMLGAALRAGDAPGLEKWSKRLQEPGMVAKPLFDVANDLLASVDRNAVLFTNGDMDTYPTLVRIHAARVRPDVLIIDRRALEDEAYRQRCWKECGGKGAAPPNGPVFATRLASSTERPVYLASSIDRVWLDELAAQLYCTGLAFRVGTAPADQMRTLEQRWKAFSKTPDAGPLSRNYLLPGSLLLQHYRVVEDEGRAAAMEHELRQFAKRTGTLDRLYQAGILIH